MATIYSKRHPVLVPVSKPISLYSIELPDGVYIQLRAKCRRCDNVYDYDGELEDWDDYYNLCGGSQYCIP